MAWYHTGLRKYLRAHPRKLALRLIRDKEKLLTSFGLTEIRHRRLEPRMAEVVSVGTEAAKTGYFKDGQTAWLPPALGLEAADGGIVIMDPEEILAVEDSA